MMFTGVSRSIGLGSMFAWLFLGLLSDGLRAQSDSPVLPEDTLPALSHEDAVPLGQLRRPIAPAENQDSLAKIQLGRELFFDPILSTDQTVSCASCHQPDHGFASPDALAIGIAGRIGKRNSPSILNIGFQESFSWDGRDDSLEAQVLGPLTNEDELGGDLPTVLKNLRGKEDYVQKFSDVFGQGTPDKSAINEQNIARAIASFERTLVAGNNRVDRFRNSEYTALPKDARKGMWIFESRGGCWQCHSGPNLTDGQFHNTGVSFGTDNRDTGREQATEDLAHRFQFKTPSLRHVAQTAPYMHDGSLKSLREVVEFYNRGGSVDDAGLDPKMKPLNLTEEEVGFVVEFLKALSGDLPGAAAEKPDSGSQMP